MWIGVDRNFKRPAHPWVDRKIVSKAEGRFVELDSVAPSEEARRLARLTGKDPRMVQIILGETDEVVRAAPNVLIVRHRLGLSWRTQASAPAPLRHRS